MTEKTEKITFADKIALGIFIAAGCLFSAGGVLGILYFYGDILKSGYLIVSIPALTGIFGGGIFFLSYGLISRAKPLSVSKSKATLSKIAATFLISITIGGAVFAPCFMFAPRRLEMREGYIEYDSEAMADYELNSQYGGLNLTFLRMVNWNPGPPTDTDTYAWGEAFYLYQLLQYFNVTGRTNGTLFRNILERIDIVLSNDDWNGDGVPGFGTDKFEGYYVEYPCWDGMVFYSVMTAARFIVETPTLDTLYSVNASGYLNKTEQMIQKWDRTNWIEFDNGPLGAYGYYLPEPERERVPYPRGIYNRIATLARVCVELYRFTNNASYLDRVVKMARHFKMTLEVNYYTDWVGQEQEMVVWPYRDSIHNYEPQKLIGNYWYKEEDISHGALELDFAVICFYMGIVFTKVDMVRFANTFYDFIFRGFDARPMFSEFISGEEKVGPEFRSVQHSYMRCYPFYRNPSLALYINHKSTELLVDDGWNSASMTSCMIYLVELGQ